MLTLDELDFDLSPAIDLDALPPATPPLAARANAARDAAWYAAIEALGAREACQILLDCHAQHGEAPPLAAVLGANSDPGTPVSVPPVLDDYLTCILSAYLRHALAALMTYLATEGEGRAPSKEDAHRLPGWTVVDARHPAIRALRLAGVSYGKLTPTAALDGLDAFALEYTAARDAIKARRKARRSRKAA